MVFATIQVEEAHTALVPPLDGSGLCTEFTGCDGTLWRRVQPFLIATPCIIAASWIVMLFFVRKLFEEFGYDGILH